MKVFYLGVDVSKKKLDLCLNYEKNSLDDNFFLNKCIFRSDLYFGSLR